MNRMNSEVRHQKPSTTVEILDAIDQIKAEDWNQIVPVDCPFLRHEFLHALEATGCVSAETGWHPQHILIRNRKCNSTLAVAPLYLKGHSWGEYIFDWNWAASYREHGLQYYPKLISQTPFTPITSPKLNVSNSSQHDVVAIRRQLVESTKVVARKHDVSSLHWLFITDDDAQVLESQQFLGRRSNVEYIWTNRNYSDMDHFLATLSSRKRKKIRSERKFIAKQNIRVSVVTGTEMTDEHWQLVNCFYQNTIKKFGSLAYLNQKFFEKIRTTMPENVVLFLAEFDNKPVGGSFCLKGGNRLFGRYWGSIAPIRNLHFEVCYYAPIEYCIQNGVSDYNAGVQGEHKLNRGFVPTIARSCHTFSDAAFSYAIDQYIRKEYSHYEQYREHLEHHSAYSRN